jgi:hypothetical protein
MGAIKKYSASFVTFVTKRVIGAPKTILAAKPARTPVDYAALRRSVMTRYRKTLAHLAK